MGIFIYKYKSEIKRKCPEGMKKSINNNQEGTYIGF